MAVVPALPPPLALPLLSLLAELLPVEKADSVGVSVGDGEGLAVASDRLAAWILSAFNCS